MLHPDSTILHVRESRPHPAMSSTDNCPTRSRAPRPASSSFARRCAHVRTARSLIRSRSATESPRLHFVHLGDSRPRGGPRSPGDHGGTPPPEGGASPRAARRPRPRTRARGDIPAALRRGGGHRRVPLGPPKPRGGKGPRGPQRRPGLPGHPHPGREVQRDTGSAGLQSWHS